MSSICQGTPLSLEDARRLTAGYVDHYNNVRLHSAIGYITPSDKLEGHETAIFADRKRKLERARLRRKANYESDISMEIKSVAINGHSGYLNFVG